MFIILLWHSYTAASGHKPRSSQLLLFVCWCMVAACTQPLRMHGRACPQCMHCYCLFVGACWLHGRACPQWHCGWTVGKPTNFSQKRGSPNSKPAACMHGKGLSTMNPPLPLHITFKACLDRACTDSDSIVAGYPLLSFAMTSLL